MPNPREIARFEGDTYDADAAWITKKALRRPKDTFQHAMDSYPEWVVHSEGHVSRNAARTSQKYIRARKGAWAAFDEYNIKVGVFPDFQEEYDAGPNTYKGIWWVAICLDFHLARGMV